MGRKRDPKPRHVTVIRYVDAGGRRCAKGDPGATPIKTTSDAYYLELPAAVKGQRKERIPLGTTDLGAAWIRLREVLVERERAALGLGDQFMLHAAQPLAAHIAAWLQTVADDGATPKRIGMLRMRITLLAELAGWQRITDVKKSSALAGLAALQRTAHDKAPAGRSAQTRNHYMGHARQFSTWLHSDGRLPEDRLAGLKPISVENDRRHDRRPPTDEEIVLLFDHLHGMDEKHLPPWRCDMSGPQRALGYQVAMCAGFRAAELRSLGPQNFDLDSGEVRLKGGVAKNRKRTLQPLPGWLTARVRTWLERGGELWAGFPAYWPGRLLKADLALTRSAWIESAEGPEQARREKSTVLCYEVDDLDGPLFFDFHSLRHWYISQMAASDGISPGALQSLSRHSDPNLTLRVYNHAKRHQTRGAVDQIPPMSGG